MNKIESSLRPLSHSNWEGVFTFLGPPKLPGGFSPYPGYGLDQDMAQESINQVKIVEREESLIYSALLLYL